MGPGYFKRDGLHRYDTDERFIETLPVEWLVIGFSEPYDPERFDYPKWLRAHPDRLNFWEPKNGRPRSDESTRAAATLAYALFEKWREENQKAGINDYGHRAEMMDIALALLSKISSPFNLTFPNLGGSAIQRISLRRFVN
jgi:hypothetical protein